MIHSKIVLLDRELIGPFGRYRSVLRLLFNSEHALRQPSDIVQQSCKIGLFFFKVILMHGQFFHDIRPAATLIAVSAFVAPEMLVEIEADAIIADHTKE